MFEYSKDIQYLMSVLFSIKLREGVIRWISKRADK